MWLSQSEASPLDLACTDPCNFPTFGKLDYITCGSGLACHTLPCKKKKKKERRQTNGKGTIYYRRLICYYWASPWFSCVCFVSIAAVNVLIRGTGITDACGYSVGWHQGLSCRSILGSVFLVVSTSSLQWVSQATAVSCAPGSGSVGP